MAPLNSEMMPKHYHLLASLLATFVTLFFSSSILPLTASFASHPTYFSPLLFAEASKDGKIRIDPMTHTVGVVNQSTFDGKVSRFRTSDVFVILFYSQKSDCPNCKSLIDGEFNEFAKKMKGIVGVLAVDCDDSPRLCRDANVHSFPSIIIYPTLPLPPFPFKDTITSANLVKAVRHLIPDGTHTITDDTSHSKFLNLHAQVPKVLIFSDKAKIAPLIVKALANSFKDKLFIGYIYSENAKPVAEKYAVVSYPHVRVIRKGKKDETYSGKFEFQNLFDWLNVFSETFVMGGGFSDTKNSASAEEEKPWKYEDFPELTKLSNVDVCFKKTSKSLCAIYVKDGSKEKDPKTGTSKLNDKETKLLEKVKAKYEKKLEGKELDFRFMWLDINYETNFKDFFAIDSLPGLVVFNPYKKTRWTKIEGTEANVETISKLLDKIISGDARFKIVPGQKLPEFIERKSEKTEDKKKEEL